MVLEQAVQTLQRITDELLERLPAASAEELTEFVSARERVVSDIREELERATSEDVRRFAPAVQSVLAKDQLIQGRMSFLKREATAKLNQTVQAKAQRSAYESSQPVDSYFFDRKK